VKEKVDQFDERNMEALRILFEQFWVLRAKEPEKYRLIREREQKLKRYIADKFGLELIVHQHFVKLEKIPVNPRAWMGLQAFAKPMDYALFCCVLAFTEQEIQDGQFLLSTLIEELQILYSGEYPLDWTNYGHRRSLVRVLKEMIELSLLQIVEGDIEHFQNNEEVQVLYELTPYTRYFMRSYPDSLLEYYTIEELLNQEWKRHSEDLRRKRVYRQLMMEPFVYRNVELDEDFDYIRKFRNRLRDDFELHTPFRLEVFKNVAMLTIPETSNKYTLFPDRRSIVDAALQTMAEIRDQQDNLTISEFGRIRLPKAELVSFVQRSKDKYGDKWAKKHRDESTEETTNQIMITWQEWNMAEMEQDGRLVKILPGAARMISHYVNKKESD
jgi:uncharacterized protein (TIGR02678 family)